MSLMSRLGSFLRSAAASPSVRRSARGLGRAAVRALREQTTDSRGSRSGRSEASSRPTGAEGRPQGRPGAAQGGSGARQSGADARSGEAGASGALADRRGDSSLALAYAPHADDRPDPGEIVWAWVPFEEDITQGKDRPVLVIAEEDALRGGTDGAGEVLVALMLTSRDRTAEGQVATDEHGATWVDIGTGDWDRKGRPSEVRADRLLRLDPEAVRREGGRLDRARFDRVASAVRDVHGL